MVTLYCPRPRLVTAADSVAPSCTSVTVRRRWWLNRAPDIRRRLNRFTLIIIQLASLRFAHLFFVFWNRQELLLLMGTENLKIYAS